MADHFHSTNCTKMLTIQVFLQISRRKQSASLSLNTKRATCATVFLGMLSIFNIKIYRCFTRTSLTQLSGKIKVFSKYKTNEFICVILRRFTAQLYMYILDGRVKGRICNFIVQKNSDIGLGLIKGALLGSHESSSNYLIKLLINI